MADRAIEVLLDEKRNFPPPKELKKSANVNGTSIYNKARKDPQAFWAKAAKELHWFKPWKKVLEWNTPWAKWFIGGKINASYNCLDRHVQGVRKNKAALIWEGEPGDERVLTYHDVWREVNKFANVLKKLGVKKGDRVCLYMGMKVLSKYLRVNDRELLEGSYEIFKQDFISVPYPITKGLEATYDYVAQTRPEIRNRKPEDFVDPSFIAELDKSGFIKKLYEGK